MDLILQNKKKVNRFCFNHTQWRHFTKTLGDLGKIIQINIFPPAPLKQLKHQRKKHPTVVLTYLKVPPSSKNGSSQDG